MEMLNFTVVRVVLCNNYWSRNLIGPYRFWVRSPRNSTSFTRMFLTKRRAGWSWDYTWAALGLYHGMLGLSYVVKFIADGHGRYGSMEDCGVSNAQCLVHLVCMNRLSACREFCGVHSCGKMAQDVGMVWKCCVIPIYMRLFSYRNFLWLVSVAFLYCCLGIVREKRGGRRGQGEDAWS